MAKKKVRSTKSDASKGRKASAKTTSRAKSRPGFSELVGRALVDADFRESLFVDRDKAIAGFSLSPEDLKSLDRLDAKTLDAHAKKLTGGRAAITIAVGISKSF